MKNEKISRRSFLKASAVASALGVMAAAPAAHAAGADEAAAQIEEENCLLKKPKYIFLFIGDGMGTAQIQSARFYKGTVDNNGAVTEADLSFHQLPPGGQRDHLRQHLLLPGLRFHGHFHCHRPQDRERCHQHVPLAPAMCPMRPLPRSCTPRRATRWAWCPP